MAASESSASTERLARAEVAGFFSSPHSAPFRADREGVGEVARAFLEVCYGALAVRPDHLDEEQLREGLLELLPARLDPQARASGQAVAIVRALLDHLNETRPNENAWKLATVLDDAEKAFPRALERGGGREVAAATKPIVRPGSKLGRNDPCPCGSGKKFKKCCGKDS